MIKVKTSIIVKLTHKIKF